MKMKISCIVLTLALIIGIGLAGCAAEEPTPGVEKTKMAIGTIGVRTDGSWSQGMYEAYLYIKDKHSDIVDVTFTDNIAWADFPVFLEMQHEAGTEVLYLDSGMTWFEALKVVGPKYPDIWYGCPLTDAAAVALLPDNVVGYDRKGEEGFFIAGVIAALLPGVDTIGYVGGFDYPDLCRRGAAMELGAKWANPNINIKYMWVGSWTDVEKGYETTSAIIHAGADVVSVTADNAGLGAIRALQEEDIWFIGFARDQNDLAPDINIVSAPMVRHDLLAERTLLDYRAGTIKHEAKQFSMAQDWSSTSPWYNISGELKALVDDLTDAIATGQIEVPNTVQEATHLGTLSPDDFGIPSAEELDIVLP